MNAVIADTSPIHFLVLIGQIRIWLEIRRPVGKLSATEAEAIQLLDPGERESIALALGDPDLVY
jgi:hypothetical protein